MEKVVIMKIERYSYYRNYKGGLRKIRLPNVVDRERERIEAVTCWRWFVPMMAGLFFSVNQCLFPLQAYMLDELFCTHFQ